MRYWRLLERIATAVTAVSWAAYFVESIRLAVDSPKVLEKKSGHTYFYRNHTLTAYITHSQVMELRILLWVAVLSVVIALVAVERGRHE